MSEQQTRSAQSDTDNLGAETELLRQMVAVRLTLSGDMLEAEAVWVQPAAKALSDCIDNIISTDKFPQKRLKEVLVQMAEPPVLLVRLDHGEFNDPDIAEVLLQFVERNGLIAQSGVACGAALLVAKGPGVKENTTAWLNSLPNQSIIEPMQEMKDEKQGNGGGQEKRKAANNQDDDLRLPEIGVEHHPIDTGHWVAELAAQLRDHEQDLLVRMEAADTLGIIGGPEDGITIPALVEALRDERWDVVKAAAQGLGTIGPESLSVVVHPLTEALKDGRWTVRYEAAKALGRIGPEAKAAIPALTQALADENDSTVRMYVAYALSKIRGREPVL